MSRNLTRLARGSDTPEESHSAVTDSACGGRSIGTGSDAIDDVCPGLEAEDFAMVSLAPPIEAGTVTDGSSLRDPSNNAAASAETLVYGVGDVHGMNDLLGRLLDAIEADAAARDMRATVVFLGDVVNRGRQTREVLDRLLSGPTRPGDDWIALRGNHEQMMLDALIAGTAGLFERWLKMGGTQTLASYGCPLKKASPDRAREFIDSRHVRFLAGLPLMHLVGSYLFVHAGVEPGVPLQQQDAKTLLTIRGRFLRKPHGLPFTVIHGHTPTDGRPRLGPGRIGVDTGAYFSGILTAVAVESNRRGQRFISVNGRDTVSIVSAER